MEYSVETMHRANIQYERPCPSCGMDVDMHVVVRPEGNGLQICLRGECDACGLCGSEAELVYVDHERQLVRVDPMALIHSEAMWNAVPD